MKRILHHPPRIAPFQKYDRPIWFVTFAMYDRKPELASSKVYGRFVRFGEQQASRGIAIGRHVIMPDHVHLFIRLVPEYELGTTIGFLKKALSAVLEQIGVQAPHWQPGFFDHLLRSAEAYSEKWEYVYQNPVRAGLVGSPEEWPYSGEIVPISF